MKFVWDIPKKYSGKFFGKIGYLFGMRELIKRILRESTAGPDYDSILVDKINPYKNSKYMEYLKPYDKSLKNGDMFYFLSLEIHLYLINEIKKILNGKTVRIGDHVEKIGEDIEFKSLSLKYDTLKSFLDKNESTNDGIMLKMKTVQRKDGELVWMENAFCYNSGYCTYFNDEDTKNGIKGKNEEWVLNITKFVEDKVNELIKSAPDEYWELRKIERKETDFK